MGAGDGEGTGELDLNDVLNYGIELLECPVSVDVGEQVRRLDGVSPRAGFGEVVSSGD